MGERESVILASVETEEALERDENGKTVSWKITCLDM